MGNLMGKQSISPTVGQSASRISHLPPKGEVGNVEGSPGNSRFPMNFPADGKWERENGKTSVLETRMRDGLKWRRLRTSSGRTYWTVELPETVLRAVVTPHQLAARLARWQSGEAKRERIAAITAQALAGIKPEAIAHMFPDMSRSQVFKHCQAAKANERKPS